MLKYQLSLLPPAVFQSNFLKAIDCYYINPYVDHPLSSFSSLNIEKDFFLDLIQITNDFKRHMKPIWIFMSMIFQKYKSLLASSNLERHYEQLLNLIEKFLKIQYLHIEFRFWGRQ